VGKYKKSSVIAPIGYLPYIDGLRALAIIFILLFHFYPEAFSAGFIGVDIFFVISGYLITSIISTELKIGSISLSLFYAKRIRRILPALVLMLTTVWVIGRTFFLADQFIYLGKQILGSALFSSNFIFWLEGGYFDVSVVEKPLLHLWSLAVEEQFYIVWPLLFTFLYRKGLKVKGTFVIVILSAGLYAIAQFIHPETAFYLLPFRAWEIGMGCLISVLSDSGFISLTSQKIHFEKSAIAALGLALLLMAMLLSFLPIPIATAMAVVGTSLIILGGVYTDLAKIFSSRALIFVGLISYPLYLWHWPILSFRAVLRTGGILTGWQGDFLCFLLLAILSISTYYFIEVPIKNRIKLSPIHVRKLLFGGMSILILLGILGYLTFNGLLLTQKQQFIKGFAAYRHYQIVPFRGGGCFGDSPDKFSEDCLAKGSQKTLLIWGDSFSMTLYPHLEKITKKLKIGLSTFSSSRCPPLLDHVQEDRPNCKANNDYIFSIVEKAKPTAVMLMCNWVEYDRVEILKYLVSTIEKIKSTGVEHVFLGGQVPYWRAPLFQLMERHLLEKGWPLPERTSDGILENIFSVEPFLQHIVKSSKTPIVGLLGEVCHEGKCLTYLKDKDKSIGASDTVLTTFDYGHPTPPAAAIYAKAVKKIIQTMFR